MVVVANLVVVSFCDSDQLTIYNVLKKLFWWVAKNFFRQIFLVAFPALFVSESSAFPEQ